MNKDALSGLLRVWFNGISPSDTNSITRGFGSGNIQSRKGCFGSLCSEISLIFNTPYNSELDARFVVPEQTQFLLQSPHHVNCWNCSDAVPTSDSVPCFWSLQGRSCVSAALAARTDVNLRCRKCEARFTGKVEISKVPDLSIVELSRGQGSYAPQGIPPSFILETELNINGVIMALAGVAYHNGAHFWVDALRVLRGTGTWMKINDMSNPPASLLDGPPTTEVIHFPFSLAPLY